MSGFVDALLDRAGVEPRGFRALARALVVMDLRNQAYARATATKPSYLITPLFWVVGQCLTLSAVTSLVLFMRVDCFFFALAGLAVSMLVLATTVVVEFHEIVLDPRDLEIIGSRPVALSTYAAARCANLVFYVGLMAVALNLFPLILGAGLRDAGPWYVPAYFLASLAGNLVTVAAVIGVLSTGGRSAGLAPLKEFLAWTQIVLILVAGYGAQLMLKDPAHGVEVWAAYPPRWLDALPPAWLARFVDGATGGRVLGVGLGLLGVAVAACVATVWRLMGLYRRMQGVPARAGRRRPMPADRLGGLATRLDRYWARGREQRVGYWLGRTMLARDPELKIRCLLPLNLSVAVVAVGIAVGQFANPLRVIQADRVVLPTLSVYLIALAMPQILYNLTFTRSFAAAWVLATAPLDRPAALALGLCQAVFLRLIVPLCALWAAVAAVVWRDPGSALLHAALAAGLAWLMGLIALTTVVREPPLSRAPVVGGSIGPLAVPMAALSSLAMVGVALHCRLAPSPLFWLIAAGIGLAAEGPLRRLAEARLARLMEDLV
jgi:hypothetical protein